MDPIKQKKSQKAMKRNINSRIAISWLFPLTIPATIFLGIAIFFPTGTNDKEFAISQYISIAIALLICLIVRFWPRKFDDRELELYDKYITDQQNLKIEIKKEKIEKESKEKIKKLEEKNSYKPAEHDTM